jgi:hypothetical protein
VPSSNLDVLAVWLRRPALLSALCSVSASRLPLLPSSSRCMIAFIVSSSGSCHSCTLLAGRLVASSNGLAPRTLVDRFDVSLCIHSLSVWFQCSCGFCQWFAGISLFVAFGLRGLKLLFFFLCYGLSKPSSKNSFFASADHFYPPVVVFLGSHLSLQSTCSPVFSRDAP